MSAASVACPYCGRVTHHAKDVEHGWCAACERFHPQGAPPTSEGEWLRWFHRFIALLEQAERVPALSASEVAEAARVRRDMITWGRASRGAAARIGRELEDEPT